jgi:hypothetical protein
MEVKNNQKEQFSTHLFWDVNPDDLSIEKNQQFIIQRVLEYGFLEDWILISKMYGLFVIVENAKKIRNLDKKALNFIASISNTPIEEFRCYTYQQSISKHWDF